MLDKWKRRSMRPGSHRDHPPSETRDGAGVRGRPAGICRESLRAHGHNRRAFDWPRSVFPKAASTGFCGHSKAKLHVRHSTIPRCFDVGTSTRLSSSIGGWTRRRLHGLEAFFQGVPGGPPPKWKMAVVTWLGVFPAVLLWSSVIRKLLSGLPSLVTTAIVSAFVVATRLRGLPCHF